MTLVDITNEIHGSSPGQYDGLIVNPRPNFYVASSLSGLVDHFKTNPHRNGRTYVFVENCEVRKLTFEEYGEQRDHGRNNLVRLLQGISDTKIARKYQSLTRRHKGNFEIRDEIMARHAYWANIQSQDYLEQEKHFGINEGEHVTIPITLVEYSPNGGERELRIIEFIDGKGDIREANKALAKKISNSVPEQTQ